MPTISRFYGMLIVMYYREGFNEKPYFHVKYNEFEAKISINDFSILKGNIPTHAYSLVKVWSEMHQKELFDNWERIKKGDQLNKIEPLS